MIKAIIFDFDGVLVESASIKTEAFREIFSKWPDKVEEGVAYHLKNMGISRYVKFRYFYENILGVPYSDKIGQELGRQFSEIVLEKIKRANFVIGTQKFLEENYRKYFFFIASGTPQEELNDIVSTKGIDKHFKGIFGTPTIKPEIVKKIMYNTGLGRENIIFIGDSESDMQAASKCGIHFILRVTLENKKCIDYNRHKIYDLTQLEDKIAEINECRMIS